MKKRILVVIIMVSLIIPKVSFCQNWIKTYEATNFIQRVLLLNDGGILAIGSNQKNQTHPLDSLVLLKIDRNGNLIKSKVLRIQISKLPIVQQADNDNFLLAFSSRLGQPANIIKFTSNLDSIESKNIVLDSNKALSITQFKKLLNGTFGIAAYSNDTAHFAKINENGDVLINQKYGRFVGTGFSGINDFVEEENGTLRLFAFAYLNKAFNFLIKIDSNLQIINTVQLETEYATEFFKTNGNNFLILANPGLVKLDNKGTPIIKAALSSFYNNYPIQRSVYLQDSSWALLSYSQPVQNFWKTKVFKLNSIGKLDTLCSLPMQIGSQVLSLYYATSIKQEEIILCGYAIDTLTQSYKGFVMKTNLSCSTSINKEFSINSFIKIYPNPVISQATIHISNEMFDEPNKSFLLFDINGKLVKNEIFSGREFQFNRQNLTNGFYIFQIKKGNQIIVTGKIFLR